MFINQQVISGNLTRDPVSKKLTDGRAVANFTIAINQDTVDKDGVKTSKPNYQDCHAFGKLAENIIASFKKGDNLIVIGKTVTKNWVDKKSGETKYKNELRVLDCGASVGFASVVISRNKAGAPVDADEPDFTPED
jgi:single-strand DNA-binding protein